ncbi:MAG: galactose oxidase [Pseudomonadota bacterium]
MSALAAVALAAGLALPPLPEPVSNNAVAAVEIAGVTYIASFSGIGGALDYKDIHKKSWVYDSASGRWQRAPDVPGGAGRLASVAVGLGETIYVFGGYTVAADGSEVSLPAVHAFDPAARRFTALAPMPVPVDDAVAVTYGGRYIYLISGWHDVGNVNLVQRYDTENDDWMQATPWPGEPVFGHAGGSVGTDIVVCDGVIVDATVVPRRFRDTRACFHGRIRADDPRRIDWQAIAPRPGGACYRAAAAGDAATGRVLFAGGGDNPYNYDGIGYDGVPAEPCGTAVAYDLTARRWQTLPAADPATMDHRGLIEAGGRFWRLGGLDAGRRPISAVTPLPAH